MFCEETEVKKAMKAELKQSALWGVTCLLGGYLSEMTRSPGTCCRRWPGAARGASQQMWTWGARGRPGGEATQRVSSLPLTPPLPRTTREDRLVSAAGRWRADARRSKADPREQHEAGQASPSRRAAERGEMCVAMRAYTCARLAAYAHASDINQRGFPSGIVILPAKTS